MRQNLRTLVIFSALAAIPFALPMGGCEAGGDGTPPPVDSGVDTGAGDMGPAMPCPTFPCETDEVCGPGGLCHTGGAGEACDRPEHCLNGLVCGPASVCHAGTEGDSCTTQVHCVDSLFCANGPDVCQDGGAGDACEFDTDCASDMGGVGIFACNPSGSTTASVCETVECRTDTHCTVAGEQCVSSTYTCQTL